MVSILFLSREFGDTYSVLAQFHPPDDLGVLPILEKRTPVLVESSSYRLDSILPLSVQLDAQITAQHGTL